MSPVQTSDLKRVLASRGIDFRVVSALEIQIDEIFRKEHIALLSAAQKLYDASDIESDDPVLETAREGLEPFL